MRGAGTIIPDAKINGPGLHVTDTLSGENSMMGWTYLCVLSSINGHGCGMTDEDFEREPGGTYRARTLKCQLSSRR